jgi:hypothetical protein
LIGYLRRVWQAMLIRLKLIRSQGEGQANVILIKNILAVENQKNTTYLCSP